MIQFVNKAYIFIYLDFLRNLLSVLLYWLYTGLIHVFRFALKYFIFSWRRKWQPTPVFLPGGFICYPKAVNIKTRTIVWHHLKHTHYKGLLINWRMRRDSIIIKLWIQNRVCLFKNFVCMLNHSVMSDSFVTPWVVADQAPLSVEFPRP